MTRHLQRDLCAFLLLCAVSLAAGKISSAFQDQNTLAPRELSLSEFRAFAAAKRGLLLDARSRDSYAGGHVPGAISFPGIYFEGSYLALQPKLEAAKSQPIVVYCSGRYCKMSDTVAQRLARLGFRNIAIFPGGWEAWQRAVLPEER